MNSEYKLHFCSAAGVLAYVVVDYDSFHLVRQVNELGELSIVLRGDHPALASLEHRSLVEVWRRDRDHELDWYCEARYLYLYYSHSTHEIGKVVIRCVDPLWWVSTRIVAWDVDVADRTLFNQCAGYIIKLLVKYNATSYATTANGRIRNGNISNLTLEDFSYSGYYYGWECSGENLLDTLQKLAPMGPGDFFMYYSGSGNWEFRWREPNMGSDLTADVTFSLELANMADPEYILDRRKEKTVAIVGGKVVRGDRLYRVTTGPDYSASNDIELWVAAPGVIDAASMDAAAMAALLAHAKVDQLKFNLVQTPQYFYGQDYTLGDLVNTSYLGVSRDLEIRQVVIDATPTGEIALLVSCW
jgi:hypothetical protein